MIQVKTVIKKRVKIKTNNETGSIANKIDEWNCHQAAKGARSFWKKASIKK